MPKFEVFYSYDLHDRNDKYMAGDKTSFLIEADDRRLIDTKELREEISRMAQSHCQKGWRVSYANYYKIQEYVPPAPEKE